MMRDLKYSKSLHEKAVNDASDYLKTERKLLATLIEIEQDRTFELHGYTHLTPYCVKALKLDETIAKCLVRIVRKSHDVPELGAAVVKGDITPYKAKAIASVITPENKDQWISKAQYLSKEKLEREVAEKSGANTKRLSHNYTFEMLDLLKRAREIVSTKQQKYATEEETLAQALAEFVHKHDPVAKAKRSRGHSSEHEVTILDNDQCQYIYEDGTQCEERKWLHQHHIHPRSQGGQDIVENLVTLCSGHHRMIHRQH